MAKNIIRATLQIQLSTSRFLLNNSSFNWSMTRKTIFLFAAFWNYYKKYSKMTKNIILNTWMKITFNIGLLLQYTYIWKWKFAYIQIKTLERSQLRISQKPQIKTATPQRVVTHSLITLNQENFHLEQEYSHYYDSVSPKSAYITKEKLRLNSPWPAIVWLVSYRDILPLIWRKSR